MHKIQEKEFTLEDFSCEHLEHTAKEDVDESILIDVSSCRDGGELYSPKGVLEIIIKELNVCRNRYLKTKDKKYWWQMIQLLPSSYNQTRNVMLNYEVLANIYEWRRTHKLDEWIEFCGWIESLPYSELITDPVWDKYYKDMDAQKHAKELDDTISDLEDRVKELTKTNEKIRMEFLKCFNK